MVTVCHQIIPPKIVPAPLPAHVYVLYTNILIAICESRKKLTEIESAKYFDTM